MTLQPQRRAIAVDLDDVIVGFATTLIECETANMIDARTWSDSERAALMGSATVPHPAPYPGALAFLDALASYHDAIVVTAPWSNPAAEEWMRKRITWLHRLQAALPLLEVAVTASKYRVDADVLIDDDGRHLAPWLKAQRMRSAALVSVGLRHPPQAIHVRRTSHRWPGLQHRWAEVAEAFSFRLDLVEPPPYRAILAAIESGHDGPALAEFDRLIAAGLGGLTVAEYGRARLQGDDQ